MIGTARLITFGNETGGWGAFYTTVKTTAAPAATTVTLNGAGGANYGCITLNSSTVVTNLKAAFLGDLAEPVHAITSIALSGSDAVLTLTAGLTDSQAAGASVVVGYWPTEAAILDSFSSKLNLNKWGTMPYSGTRAKNLNRRSGRLEADGSMTFMLYSDANISLLVHAIGSDLNVTGTVPGVPVNTTSTAGGAAGALTITVTSATGLATSDVIQIGVGTLAECRKITNIASLVLTVDKAFTYTHATSAAVAKVIAPFIHSVPSSAINNKSMAFEDWIPYDDLSNVANNQAAKYSYYLSGVMMKSVKMESNAEHGTTVNIEYDAQNKVKIPVSNAIALASDTVYNYLQSAILISSTRNYRISEVNVEVANDNQKVFTHNGSNIAFAIKAGQQEVKGSFKFFEDETTQAQFWSALINDTVLGFSWTTTDAVTLNSVSVSIPKIVVDDYNDGEFSPADLIYGNINFMGLLDSGATNVQLTLTVNSTRYLSYTEN